MSDIKEVLKQQISQNNILIFMKGTPYEPQCGFSAKTVQALIECGVEFSFVDVLANQQARQVLPEVSEWPTFPQVFVKGELIGGCDIVLHCEPNIANTKKSCEGAGFASLRLMKKIKELKAFN